MKIEDIKDPSFLKDLTYKELDELANEIRKCILETVSKHGGHLSSNLGVVELTIALHRSFNMPFDKVLFDVGHQTYTHKILTGRTKEFKESLRKHNGLSGFQKISESEYDFIEAGHSSTSISIASGMALARDLNKENYHIVSVIGDSSIVSGLSLEAMNCLGNQNNKVIIILNDNEMSISEPIGGIHKMLNGIRGNSNYINTKLNLKNLLNRKGLRWLYRLSKATKNAIKSLFYQPNIFEDLSLEYLGPYDGHNIKELEKAFDSAKKLDKSVVIHVITKKGKGYKFAEEDKIGYWHGVSPFDINTGLPLNENNKDVISFSECIANHLNDEMITNKDIIAITPAMINGSKLENIFDKYNERAIDLGINEEHSVTFASGLALNKKRSFLCIYSTFMQRAYDNLNNDIARMNLPLVVGVDRAGLSGEDGDTHLGIYDVEITKGLRNSVIAMPLDNLDAKNVLSLAFKSNNLFFIRYPKANININDNYNFSNKLEIGKWDILNKGNDNILIISTGPITKDINKIIKEKYNDINLIFARFYKPIDKELLLNNIKNIKNLIIYDIYSTKYGLYEDICAFLIENNINVNIINLTIPNTKIGHGKIDDLLIDLKLSIKDLENKINEIR